MRSYSVQRTITLLSAIAATAAAVRTRDNEVTAPREARRLIDNFDVLTTNGEGLLVKIWGEEDAPRTGAIVDNIRPRGVGVGPENPLSAAMGSAAAQSSKVRGGTIHQGSGSLVGQVGGKGIGKGYAYRKDCKKHKGSKGKGSGKGSPDGKGTKGGKAFFEKGDGKFSRNPTNRPTMPPTNSPSEAPTDSPTEEWCHEDYWENQPHHSHNSYPTNPTPRPTSNPTKSPQPTVSPAPSNSPTVSPAPTVSPRPTVTGAPSGQPSDSHAPNYTPPPSSTPGTSPGQEAKSYCQLLNAQYIDSGESIAIWNPQLERPEFTQDATAAIKAAIESPIDTSETQAFAATVSFIVSDDDAVDKTEIQRELDNAITSPTILQIIGCQAEAIAFAENYYNENKIERATRNLQSEPESSFIAMRKWSCSEKTDCDGEECNINCGTGLNYIGSLTFEDIQDVLFWSLKEYFSLLDDVTTWYPRQSLEEKDIEVEAVDPLSFNGINEIETNNSAKSGMRAGPFIGAATGLLAVLLLIVLFVRRRRYGQEEISHLKLDDEDDTFYQGSDGGSVPRDEYNTRDTHIVGEGDSVISHWTGYTGRKTPSHENYELNYNRSGLMKGSPADVHQCSSATCEICHENRQEGVRFVKTGVLPDLPERTHSLPSENSRDYVQEDTVML